ncbi:MAG TPA: c-type cytochrome biogenesis protein CcmI [Rheinheimera sp.]|uniref:c-type cytochrome biogenesis protein CcmI n=1 Tax=Rheinheimera sp. TaxID=1869214 RepID=UPI002B4A16C6|nr:c-type cytochrome biogenesis protein CcmI [Rheinheimera sp.]HJS16029.1 c-type cytochrome biogenesis protein CcmI [Rheinheimera sp.]
MLMSLSFAAALMLALILVLLLFFRRKGEEVQLSPVAQFEDKLRLLSQARDNGELAEQDFVQAAAELKTQYLQSQQSQQTVASPATAWVLGTSLLIVVGTAALYSLTGHFTALQNWQTAQQQLPAYGERALLNQGEPLTEEEIELFALALRTKISKEGDDAVAWFVIGRIWLSKGMLDDAIEAFEKALALTPNRVNVLISYSQALLVASGDENLAKAGLSLAKVLQQDPDNSDALSMLAMVAEERGDKEQAQQAWQLLLPKLDKADPRYALVQQKLGLASTPEQAATSEQTATTAVSGRQVSVQLTINPQLAEHYKTGTLFVFAKAVDGPPLPLAVQKLAVFNGTQTIELSEAQAMQPGWTLANAERIQISARLSLSGQVLNDENGPQVQSEVLSFNEPKLSLSLSLQP